MKRLLTFSLVLACIAVACRPASQKEMNTTPDGQLVRAETPSAEISSALAAFETAFKADSIDIHSIMVLKDGCVVAEKWWGEGSPDTPHIMNSVSKSFTAAAVGFAISEGLVSLDDKVTGFFPDKVPAEHAPGLDAMTVRHLLTMSTGQVRQPPRSGQDWIADFMAAPVEDTPGANFRYNSMATFMLSAIVQKVSGQKLTEYLGTRLFGPLGITGYRLDESPDGIATGGWGLYIKTEDMAKFGQLFLQNGVWNGEQLLPEGWVAEASTWKIASGPAGNETMQDPASDWTQGYCYQMWRSRHNSYRADGAGGQYILVLPDVNAVVAVTANLRDMQAELNLVWDHILPALTIHNPKQ